MLICVCECTLCASKVAKTVQVKNTHAPSAQFSSLFRFFGYFGSNKQILIAIRIIFIQYYTFYTERICYINSLCSTFIEVLWVYFISLSPSYLGALVYIQDTLSISYSLPRLTPVFLADSVNCRLSMVMPFLPKLLFTELSLLLFFFTCIFGRPWRNGDDITKGGQAAGILHNKKTREKQEKNERII